MKYNLRQIFHSEIRKLTWLILKTSIIREGNEGNLPRQHFHDVPEKYIEKIILYIQIH